MSTRTAVGPLSVIVEAVAFNAVKNPGSLAVSDGTRDLAYGDLEGQANRLANYLKNCGIDKDSVVAICLERSVSMVVAMLAAMKAGAAYMPLDPAYPDDRLRYMLHDSGAKLLLTRSGICDELKKNVSNVVELDKVGAELAKLPKSAPEVAVGPSSLAYVIYTSGSDGQPKGVEITHSALSNLIDWHCTAFDVTERERASQVASIGFDAAVWEIWPYLAAGACVHICPDEVRTNPDTLVKWLNQERITIAFAPTAMAELLMATTWPSPSTLRTLLTGADTLHRFPSSTLPFRVVNNYGPTECAVVATSGSAVAGQKGKPSIGKAIDNVEVVLLDEALKPTPKGDVGEICIGGAGLARGYVNRKDLSAEKFIQHPMKPGARLYRSGDLGRELASGEFEFIGRRDSQIKLHGYRIEPNEIVQALDQHEGVQASVVVDRDDSKGNKQLVAYVVPAEESLSYARILTHLRDRLPDYMVPHILVRMNTLPINANGKIDRNRLPAPDASNIIADTTASEKASPVALRVAAILAELLGLPEISAEDNFFFLGGHSLLGTQLISRLRDEFGVELTLRRVFDSPTAAELAEEIEARMEEAQPARV